MVGYYRSFASPHFRTVLEAFVPVVHVNNTEKYKLVGFAYFEILFLHSTRYNYTNKIE